MGACSPTRFGRFTVRVRGPVEVAWGDGTQTDFYDQPEQVGPAIEAVDHHPHRHDAGRRGGSRGDHREVGRRSARSPRCSMLIYDLESGSPPGPCSQARSASTTRRRGGGNRPASNAEHEHIRRPFSHEQMFLTTAHDRALRAPSGGQHDGGQRGVDSQHFLFTCSPFRAHWSPWASRHASTRSSRYFATVLPVVFVLGVFHHGSAGRHRRPERSGLRRHSPHPGATPDPVAGRGGVLSGDGRRRTRRRAGGDGPATAPAPGPVHCGEHGVGHQQRCRWCRVALGSPAWRRGRSRSAPACWLVPCSPLRSSSTRTAATASSTSDQQRPRSSWDPTA